jgi:hypothetical protein
VKHQKHGPPVPHTRFIESDEEAGIPRTVSERHAYRAMTRSASGACRSSR